MRYTLTSDKFSEAEHNGTGVAIVPRPTTGTIDGAPSIQTPSRAEHGPEGRFFLQPQVPSSRKSSS